MGTPELRPGVRRRETPRKGDVRETAILDAAELLLEEHGFDDVTVEQIANGAGISRASLYFYFGSKQDVLTALVARTVALIVEDAAFALDDVTSEPRETVRRTLRRTEAKWKEHGRVMRAAVELSGVVPEINRLWSQTMIQSMDAVTEVLVRAGLPRGRGVSDAPAVARTLCWMTERNFYAASSDMLGDGYSLRRASDAAWLVWAAVLDSAQED